MTPRRRPHPVVAEAVLLQTAGDRTWSARLPNGCVFVAWVPAWKTGQWPLAAGDHVTVELSTYDFGIGRIAGPVADGPASGESIACPR